MNVDVAISAREDVPAWLTYGAPVFTIIAALLVGAIAGTWVGLNLGLPAVVLIPLMLVAAGLAGAVWAGVPGWLRAKWDVNEIITTLLLTFVAIELNGYMVRGPMQGGEGNFPVSDVFPAAATPPNIPGTDVHVGLLVALLGAAVVYWLLRSTRLGFEIRFVGSNSEAARQAGMNDSLVYVFVLVAGGALAAMGGIMEVAAVQGRLRPEFSPGYGFTAIPIALLGRNGAPQVVLAGLFFAVLFVGGFAIRTQFGVPAALVDVIQALIILFLITAEFVKQYRLSIAIERGPPADAPAADGEVA